MKLRLTASAILVSICASSAFADDADSTTIVSHINQPQSTVRVIAPQSMLARLRHAVAESAAIESDEDEASEPRVAHRVKAGYRIQVFDDNNVRTAKQEARNRQHQIEMRFPEFKTYVSFNSPYWRVKVGDFRSRGEAESAMAEIKHAFPALARQIRIVRDRININ